MSTYSFGEVSWNAGTNNKSKNMKDLFLRLMPGNNVLRIVTPAFQYVVHKYKAEGEKGYGRKVVCSATKDDPSCPLCEAGDKAKRKWYVGVIDRKTNSYKIMDISYTVFQQIGALVNDKMWGDITTYNINILVKPEAGATGYYTVMPYGKEPLSAEDHVLVDTNVDLEYLKKLTTPPSYKAVEEKISKIHESLAGGGAISNTTTAAKPAAKKGKPVVPVADDSEEFEDYN
jgi:hypothetical protein